MCVATKTSKYRHRECWGDRGEHLERRVSSHWFEKQSSGTFWFCKTKDGEQEEETLRREHGPVLFGRILDSAKEEIGE